MKPETLETLLLDRALGELAPEAAELLDAWCEEHPAAAAEAAAFAATLQLAREASAGPAPAMRPPPPPLRLGPPRRIRMPELLRLAACLALGASLGWLVRPSPQTSSAPVLAVVPPVLAAAAEADAAPSRFWSISARLDAARRRVTPAERPPSRRGFLRPSLLKMPQPESSS